MKGNNTCQGGDTTGCKEVEISATTADAMTPDVRSLDQQSDPPATSERCSNNDNIFGQPISFIDHNSYFDCFDSCTDCPLLDRMKRAYSTLCLVRKSCEINGFNHQEMQTQLRNETMGLRPAKYSDIVPYSKILFVGVMDFAKSAFADFTKLPSEIRYSLVQSNFQLLQSLDGSYRAVHNFPNDDTIMASYTTYLNNETIEEFFSGCPPEFKSEDVFEEFRKNIKKTIELTKSKFREVQPTIDEFIAVLGMALWNGYTTNLSAEVSAVVRRNRRAILKELQNVYSRNSSNVDASRLKEVFGLLSKSFHAIQS